MTSTTKTRAVAYVRVSTEEQANEGVSLEAQEVKVRAYCALRGLELVELVVDAGVSAGKGLNTRDGGARVLELVKGRKVEAVVAMKLDRLFRDASDCLAVTAAWDKASVSLHLVDMGGQAVDTSSAMGRFFLTIMAGAAEMERNQIRERTRMAMAHKRSKHELVGAVPYGFTLHDDGVRLVENNAEQLVIREARTLREAGLSLRGIAAALAARGFHARNGSVFDSQQVRRIAPSRAEAVAVA